MRTEVGHHFLLASAEDEAVSKGRKTRTDLNRASTSIVHHTVIEAPAVDVPRPAGNRAIDKRCPKEHEDHHGNDATSLSDSTSCNCGGGCAELHLWAESAHGGSSPRRGITDLVESIE